MRAQAARQFLTSHAGPRLALIGESFERLTGRPLLGATAWSAEALWAAPLAVLAHGAEADPILFYGNRLGLELFEVTPEELVRMPSRLTAEAPERAERAQLLEAVSRRGFIDDYAGVRISAAGRRFRIEQATVWSLTDGAGVYCGQAAAFGRWTRLDAA
jgi:hypothetical protein